MAEEETYRYRPGGKLIMNRRELFGLMLVEPSCETEEYRFANEVTRKKATIEIYDDRPRTTDQVIRVGTHAAQCEVVIKADDHVTIGQMIDFALEQLMKSVNP